jgi:hypothetical protein
MLLQSLIRTNGPLIPCGQGKGGGGNQQPPHDGRDTGAASGGGVGPGLPAPEKGLFPESRILELMSWKKIQRTGT